jgi:hypothetical protein
MIFDLPMPDITRNTTSGKVNLKSPDFSFAASAARSVQQIGNLTTRAQLAALGLEWTP